MKTREKEYGWTSQGTYNSRLRYPGWGWGGAGLREGQRWLGKGRRYINRCPELIVFPQHVHKACQAGADLICAQGGEAGGHTGDIPTRYVASYSPPTRYWSLHPSLTSASSTSSLSLSSSSHGAKIREGKERGGGGGKTETDPTTASSRRPAPTSSNNTHHH